MSDVNGQWVEGEVFVPDGFHLATAKDLPGIDRAMLFGAEHGTSGPTLFRSAASKPSEVTSPSNLKLPDSLDLKTVVIAATALAIGVVSTVVVVKYGSKIKTWWSGVAFPRLMSGALWLADIDPSDFIDSTTEIAAIGPVATSAFADEVGEVVKDLRKDMSNEEAQERLLLVFMAASIIADQMRKLGNARIADNDLRSLSAAMGELTKKQVVDQLDAILGSRESLLDDETSAMFVKVFGGGEFVDDTYKPLTLEQVKDALRLPDEDDESDDGMALASA